MHYHYPSHLVRFLWLFIIIRPVTVLLHELGHAFVALILTKDRVSVFIGSYGDRERSFKTSIGRLEIFLKPTLLSFTQGLCIPAANMPTANKLLFLRFGLTISALTAAVAMCAATFLPHHEFLRAIFIIFSISAWWDFFANLIPIRKPIKLNDGAIIYNDGFTMLRLNNYLKYEKALPTIESYNRDKQYDKALALIEHLFKPKISFVEVYRKALITAANAARPDKMMQFYTMAVNNMSLTSSEHRTMATVFNTQNKGKEALQALDRAVLLDPAALDAFTAAEQDSMGVVMAQNNKMDEALIVFNKAVEIDGELGIALVNRGFCNLVMGNYQAAMSDLESGLSKGEPAAYCYANLGLTKIKLGNIEKGFSDIEHAIEIDPNEAYAYRSKGIYYMDTGDKIKAMDNFKKARTLNAGCYEIDDLIASIR